jgi:hypothetical protein
MTASRVSWGTHAVFRAPQVLFLTERGLPLCWLPDYAVCRREPGVPAR